MKCVITGKETSTLTKNVPLSKEGRVLLEELTDKYNQELEKMFIKKFTDRSENTSEELAVAISKKVVKKATKNELLKAFSVYSVEEVFEQFSETKQDQGIEENE